MKDRSPDEASAIPNAALNKAKMGLLLEEKSIIERQSKPPLRPKKTLQEKLMTGDLEPSIERTLDEGGRAIVSGTQTNSGPLVRVDIEKQLTISEHSDDSVTGPRTDAPDQMTTIIAASPAKQFEK